LDKLLLVIDFSVKFIEILNQTAASEWTVGFYEGCVTCFKLGVKFVPLLVHDLPIFLVLLDCVFLPLRGAHLEGLIEGQRIDLLQDGLECDQRLLQDLVPVVLSQMHNNGHQHGECFLLVGFENVQEIVILEEAHGSVSNLQMDSSDALHDPLEQLADERLHLVDLAHLEDLLQFSQE